MILPRSLIISCFVTAVASHGFVESVVVDGQSYPGFDPNSDPYASPVPARVIRKIPSDGPVTAMTSTDLTCNKGGQAGSSMSANVKAGGTVVWEWNQWLSDHLGPVSTYMASCKGKCADVNLDSTTLSWFKIDEKAFDPSGSGSLGTGNGRWGSEDLIANGDKWTSTVPAELTAGEYLMRHEVVALHSSPAQPYPACLQVIVSGSGSATPSTSELVSIPGDSVYNSFQWPNIWSGNIGDFKAPGPTVAAIAGGSADPASGGSASAPAGTSSAAPTSMGTAATVAVPTQTGTVGATSKSEVGSATSIANNPSATSSGMSCNVRRSETRSRNKKRHVRSSH